MRLDMEDFGQVRLRQATHSDCSAIKDIDRNIYEGNDPFLYKFHSTLEKRNAIHVVMEVDSKITGYLCGEVIENGRVIILKHARVSYKQRRQGLLSKIVTAVLDRAKAAFPNLDIVVSTGASLDEAKQQVERRPYKKITLHMNGIEAVINPRVNRSFSFKQNIPVLSQITAVSKLEALRLLSEEICHLPYSPARPLIGFQPSGWHTSSLKEFLRRADLYIERCPESNKITSFCLLAARGRDRGHTIEANIFVDNASNHVDKVIDFISLIMQSLVVFYLNDTLTLTFCFSENIEADFIQSWFTTTFGIYSENKHVVMIEYRYSDISTPDVPDKTIVK